MSCFGLKGGIGTASRRLRIGREDFRLGALVLANYGQAGDLWLPDRRRVPAGTRGPERGSVIVVIATDVPLEHRQLRRVAARGGDWLDRLRNRHLVDVGLSLLAGQGTGGFTPRSGRRFPRATPGKPWHERDGVGRRSSDAASDGSGRRSWRVLRGSVAPAEVT